MDDRDLDVGSQAISNIRIGGFAAAYSLATLSFVAIEISPSVP